MANRQPKEKRALSDHKKVGKRFVPPLLQFEKVVETSWIEVGIPELVWIALLLDSYGLKKATDLACAIAKTYAGIRGESWFASLSTLCPIDSGELTKITSILKDEGVWSDLQKALIPLTVHYPDSPLAFLGPDDPLSDGERQWELERVKRVLATLYDRASRESMLTQATALYLGAVHGNIFFQENSIFRDFDEITKYPKTPRSVEVAAAIRSMMVILTGRLLKVGDPSWPAAFWNQGLRIERCYIMADAVREDVPEPIDPRILDICSRYLQNVRRDFEERMYLRKQDYSKREVEEVIGGLISRQVTVAIELAQSPGILNSHIAPMVLRTMADTHITLAWILLDPVERSRRYQLFGLGQQKLFGENLRDAASKTEDGAILEEAADILVSELGTERNPDLTTVDVGAWSGKTTREMAIETGLEDFYKFAYTPFSACTHSTWQHVRTYNLVQCCNPLHGFHRVPFLRSAPIYVDYLFRAAKYVQKSFQLIDEFLDLSGPTPSAFDILCADLLKTEGDVEHEEDETASE